MNKSKECLIVAIDALKQIDDDENIRYDYVHYIGENMVKVLISDGKTYSTMVLLIKNGKAKLLESCEL